jgi:hypothetical protein
LSDRQRKRPAGGHGRADHPAASDPPTHRPEPGRPITERQAEARRANGRKSRGPVSPAGKSRSRTNAVKHGAYAVRVPFIEHGVLREDPAEATRFTESVVNALDPLWDDWLIMLASDVARVRWAIQRLDRWAAIGLRFDVSGSPDPSLLDYFAGRDDAAAATISHLEDPTLTVDDLSNVLGRLGQIPACTDRGWTELPDAPPAGQLRSTITDLADRFFDGVANAGVVLHQEASARRATANAIRDPLITEFV